VSEQLVVCFIFALRSMPAYLCIIFYFDWICLLVTFEKLSDLKTAEVRKAKKILHIWGIPSIMTCTKILISW